MNLPKQLTIKEITAVENPKRIGFINSHSLMIASETGASIVNWPDNVTIKNIYKSDMFPLQCFLNNKKNAIAVSSPFRVNLYNLEGEKTWALNKQNASIVFTPSDTLYALSGSTLECNTGETFNVPGDAPFWYGVIAAHPTKEKIFYTNYEPTSNSVLFTVNLDQDPVVTTSQELPNPSNKSDNMTFAQLHSPCENIIALSYPTNETWTLYNPENHTLILEDIRCRTLAFHPTKSLLAMLTKDGYIELYDFKTKKTISRTTESLGQVPAWESLNERLIDFSEGGDFLAVIVDKKCFVVSNLYPKID